jgi:hypothetical protein
MNTTCRLVTLSTLVALLGLSACVWDRGMSHGYRDGRSGQRGASHDAETRGDYHDRDGRPCDQNGRGGDREHDDDCRASNRR